MGASQIFTIGHSTHSTEEFIGMLRSADVDLVADVRTVPKSRHNPQFAEEALRVSLPESGIGYRRLPGLGGLRHVRKDELTGLNDGWRNASFRNYAEYMQTPEFADALDGLIELAGEHTVAIMCAEAVPWRCHRSLIGDALTVRGIEVGDIMSATQIKPHTLTRFARVEGTRITYPAGEQLDDPPGD